MSAGDAAQHDTLERLLDEIETRDGDAAQGERAQKTGTPPESGAGAPSGELLSSLLSSPQGAQLLSKLPQLLSALGQSGGAGKSSPSPSAEPDAVTLLCALRPYLGERRRRMVDSMMQMQKLRSLLRAVRPE